MKVVIVFAIGVLSVSLCWAQSAPVRYELSESLEERMPDFRAFDSSADETADPISHSLSPFGSRDLVLVEESDLTQVPYEDSFAKAVVFENNAPVVTVLVRGYRSFSFSWINEDLLHVFSSPGRCVTLDRIYDTSTREVIFGAAYQHCGTQSGSLQ